MGCGKLVGDPCVAARVMRSGLSERRIRSGGMPEALMLGIVNGEAPLSRDLATLMIDAIHGLEERDRTRERLSELSMREREILGHVALGARNRQIAASLTISEFTVKRHMQNIHKKLGVDTRRAAADFYRAAQAELVGTSV